MLKQHLLPKRPKLCQVRVKLYSLTRWWNKNLLCTIKPKVNISNHYHNKHCCLWRFALNSHNIKTAGSLQTKTYFFNDITANADTDQPLSKTRTSVSITIWSMQAHAHTMFQSRLTETHHCDPQHSYHSFVLQINSHGPTLCGSVTLWQSVEAVIKRSRVQLWPTALFTKALGKPLSLTCTHTRVFTKQWFGAIGKTVMLCSYKG